MKDSSSFPPFEADGQGLDAYLEAILALQRRIIAAQRELLNRAAAQMTATIRSGGRIFTFGAGHSHLLAEESFYRAGGLAQATPVFSSMLMLHEKPALGSRLERTGNLAEVLLNTYAPQSGEMIFIYSNSGVNRLPVEMALSARQCDLFIVSVSSHAYSRSAPLSDLGLRLDQIADIALDNGGEPGDALIPVEGSPWRVAPSSTISAALLWNCLLTETAFRLHALGEPLPVFASLNMPGAAEHNQALLATWRPRNPHL
jgi:uncharacterized phosphosugar-binding protein